MKNRKLEKTIRRSRAAELLTVHPRTLIRYEARGLLTPIKLNSRLVVYLESQVRALFDTGTAAESDLATAKGS